VAFATFTAMPANAIVDRVADFLRKHPPFDRMAAARLERLAQGVHIRYLKPGDVLFAQGDAGSGEVHVLRQGSLELRQQEGALDRLADLCDEGEVIGVRALLAEQPYLTSARAAEECIVYSIPGSLFKQVLGEEPAAVTFFAAGFAAGMPVVRRNLEGTDQARIAFRPSPPGLRSGLLDTVRISGVKPVVTCTADEVLRVAAERMTKHRVRCIIVVDGAHCPIGIITDTDFRRKVGTGLVAVDAPCGSIMSSPVITVEPDRSLAELTLLMIGHHVHHLCVTADGTPQSPVIGILSEHDLVLQEGNSPGVLVRRLKLAADATELSTIRASAEVLILDYLKQEVRSGFLSDLVTVLNDALIERAIELSRKALLEQGLAAPDVAWCWLSLGSEGRGEQLVRTDQDNALVYADPPPELAGSCRAYFLKLAEGVVSILEQAGFERCPANMMASNPEWCLPISAWKGQFSNWIRTPEPKAVMLSTIFFDFRAVHGDRSLATELSEHIHAEITGSALFLPMLAANALQNPPPLSFFRGLVVERSGEHKDRFDLKARALMPLVDAARVLSMHKGIRGINNTGERFRWLAAQEPEQAELYHEAAKAFDILLRYRAESGFREGDSGRFIEPEKLDRIQRQILRNAFEPIAEVQEVVKVRFRVDQLRLG
jgi:CBS domain-containing protein